MYKIKNILLVCTGNSCRSVMAAGFLKKLLKDKGDFQINTAGTTTLIGRAPTVEAIRVMADEDINVASHRSQPVTKHLIDQADLILVMERWHKQNILLLEPAAKDKVHLLSEFGRIENEAKLVDPNIPDPIGKPLEFYRQVFAIIKEGVARSAKKILEEAQ